MNYPDSVHFLYALGNEIKTAKFGLERISTVLDALGRPQDRCRFVHVAGTNGKGSTIAFMRAMLEATGARVLWQGRGDSVVIGDDADDWDAVILVEYPSRAKFLEMVSRPDYQEQSSHRTSALADSRLVACTEVFRNL